MISLQKLVVNIINIRGLCLNNRKDISMSNANYSVPVPKNEPVLDYAPNTHRRTILETELKRQLSHIEKIPQVIHGERFFTGKTSFVTSPHDHQHKIAELSECDANQIQKAITSCCEAQKKWNQLPWSARAAVFLKAADLLTEKYREKINVATMIGQSKTIYQAEIDAVCELADFWRFNALYAQEINQDQPYSPDGQWNRVSPRGLEGFVFAVGPFNFTSISLNLATAPALMGCSVLWKPAKTAMLASYYLLEVLEEAGLPPGVINLVSGDAKLIGDLAIKSPDLAGIHFTGSTPTFNHLWKEVGLNISNYKTYPRLVGETGGKDFIFAAPSSDQDTLVTALLRADFEYQGQKCSAASRAYIPKSIWVKIKPKLIAEVEKITMSSPHDFKNFMAAVIDERAFKKITAYIDQAKNDKDAEIIVGGDYSDETGYFIRPTIIECSKASYATMSDELFGPVLSIYVYEDTELEETLHICDTTTPYALTGAIFAKDRNEVESMAKALEYSAGNFYINDKPTGAVVGQQPFGGSRASGTNDKAGSKYNLMRWTSLRTMKETFNAPVKWDYPHMES